MRLGIGLTIFLPGRQGVGALAVSVGAAAITLGASGTLAEEGLSGSASMTLDTGTSTLTGTGALANAGDGITFSQTGVIGISLTALTLSGLWQPDFSASPWVGTASGGTSGSNNLSEATVPPTTGTTVNGHVPAHFDGTDDVITAGGTTATYYTASAYTMIALVKVNSFSAGDPGAAQPYGCPPLLFSNKGGAATGSPAGGIVGSGASGVLRVGCYDGVSWKSAAVAVSTGSWMVLMAYYDGTHMNVSVNNGTPVQTAMGSAFTTTDTVGIGTKSSGSSVAPGLDMLVGITANTTLSSAVRAGIYQTLKNTYPGCSLP
jgi:hypothetical protein